MTVGRKTDEIKSSRKARSSNTGTNPPTIHHQTEKILGV